MIIMGYPGIGKSTISRNCDNVIDLESSCFNVGNSKIPNWYVAYCQVAIDLSMQLNTVFVSSHADVVKQFQSRHPFPWYETVAVCYPILDLKEEWTKRLRKRAEHTKLAKDHRAYMRAATHFEDDITALMKTPFVQIQIGNMDYYLDKLIRKYEV